LVFFSALASKPALGHRHYFIPDGQTASSLALQVTTDILNMPCKDKLYK